MAARNRSRKRSASKPAPVSEDLSSGTRSKEVWSESSLEHSYLLPWIFYVLILLVAVLYPIDQMDFSLELARGADPRLLNLEDNSATALLSSAPFWAVQLYLAFSFYLIYKEKHSSSKSSTLTSTQTFLKNHVREADLDRLTMHWHLSNATIWSFFCDSLSGLFAIMPRFRIIYYKIDSRHLLDMDMRSGLDAVYWTEFLIHSPLCFIGFLAHLYKWPGRRILDVVISGIQFCGTICYYAPGVADGGKYTQTGEPLIFWLGTVVGGLAWTVIPALVVRRQMRIEGEIGEMLEKCSCLKKGA